MVQRVAEQVRDQLADTPWIAIDRLIEGEVGLDHPFRKAGAELFHHLVEDGCHILRRVTVHGDTAAEVPLREVFLDGRL